MLLHLKPYYFQAFNSLSYIDLSSKIMTIIHMPLSKYLLNHLTT